ncbi:lanC-like protein 2 [Orussus abietinus]|uniref:lanC-like protein 2 n=1 Tax=Orussus abietinus TaxID=222816 RepID=UPI000626E6DD|nr:lanC-like protein 2 [Orussus abietinus]
MTTTSSATSSDNRYYKNPFNDFNQGNSRDILDGNQVHRIFRDRLNNSIKDLLQRLDKNKKYWDVNDEYSIYTGVAGIAFLFYQHGKQFNDHISNKRAAELIERSIKGFHSKHRVAFLTGTAGPVALGAVFNHTQAKQEDATSMIKMLRHFSKYVLNDMDKVPNELLYGRAGYLFGLLFVNSTISPPPIDAELIKQVAAKIINSGRVYSEKNKSKSILMYEWHDKEYLGGAHGLSGILYVLLQAREYLNQDQLKVVESAIEDLGQFKFSSGNFPSSVGNKADKLVHWCHGAPSFAMLFSLASEIFKREDFYEIAVECGEVVWSRGLLKKGYGLCHGVAGNGYTFLYLYKQTKDIKYLYRACKFAEWCMDYGTHQSRTPDRPFSLFEGLAGTIYFLMDCQNPAEAKFPGYTG